MGGIDFEHVCDIAPRRTTDGVIEAFMPQSRYANRRGLPLNTYGAGPFCKFAIPSSYPVSGVYIISLDGELLYVGETANLSKRFNAGYGNISPRNCFAGGQQTNCRVNSLILAAASAGRSIALWFHSTHDYKVREAALRSALRWTWNKI